MSLKVAAMLFVAAIVLAAGCATQELHRDGVVDVDSGRFEEGLQKLEQASRESPDNLAYRLDLQSRRAAVLQLLLQSADRARLDGDADGAERTYRRVQTIEPGNEPAARGIALIEAERRHVTVIAAAEKNFDAGKIDEAENQVRQVLAEDPSFGPASELQTRIDMAQGPAGVTPRLRAAKNNPVTLEFRDASTKMVFEVLSRQTGINFIFDKDVRSDGKTSIFVRNVPVEQAVDLVLGQNQLARQVLSENMVLIYPNTSAKQKEYQDQIVKTLYLTNTDAKRAQELLKTVLSAKTLFVDDKANLIVIRDTPEVVRMAEKLVASLDMVEPEVMMEVEVLEVTRSLMDDLGITYPTGATLTMTPLASGGFKLSDIGNQTSSTIAFSPPPSVTLNIMKQSATTNTLGSPRIRARNREKAKILIGSRVPVITTSVTPTAGTAVSSGSVQYLDVGLTLEVEPDVHPDGEVAIKINLEVSSILKEVRVIESGTVAYEIGTRNATTLLTLKDGETQILGGLISDTDTRNAATIPGLGDIPVLGRLFGSRSSNKGKTEIVLSITPRIIRTSVRPPGQVTEFWYGTEANMRGAPLAGPASAPAAATGTPASAPAARPPVLAPAPSVTGSQPLSSMPSSSYSGSAAAPVVTTPIVTGPAAVPQAAPPQAAPQEAPPTASVESAPQSQSTAMAAAADTAMPDAMPALAAVAAVAAVSEPRAPAATMGPPSLGWEGPAEVKVGENFTVTLTLASAEPLVRLRSQARFNPAVLKLVSADVGDLVPSALQAASTPRVNPGVGNTQLVVVASKDSPVQGTGNLLVLHFTALAASGPTPISLQFAATGSDGRDAGVVVPRPLPVSVNP